MWRRLRAPMRRDRLSAGIILFALLIITGMGAVIEAQIVRDRDDRIAEVMRENANLARAFEEHTVRTLGYIDEIALALKGRYQAEGAKFDLPTFWQQTRPYPALLRDAVITDAAGQIIMSTQGIPPGPRVSLADREHIKVHLSGQDGGQVLISKPMLGRINKQWSVLATSRANKADGTLAGVVSVAIDPAYFSNFYRDVYLGTGNTVTLVGTDGIVRARLAADSADLGQDISGGSAFKRMMASSVEPSAAAVTYIGSSAVDGIERVYAARRIHGYPLLVFVGAPVSEVLASEAMQARNYRFAASGSSLLIGVFALTLVSFSRRRGVAARALRSASDLLERTGALARVGGWELDVRSNALSWSKQTCRIHEVDPSFAPTLEQAIAFYAPEARPVIEAALRAGIEHGTPWDLELPLITAKGRRIWARAQGSVVFEHGVVVKLVGAFQDVTLRRESDAQLHLLETAVSRLNDIVVITEAEPISEPGPRIVFVNDAFVRLTGFSREEVIGKTPRILQRASTDRSELDRIRRALERWQPVRAEVLNYTKGGEQFWLELDIAPIADAAGGFTHWVSVERDITKRKVAEEQLRQSAQRTRRLLRAATVGLWEWNLLTDAVYFSPEWKRLLGYADDEIVNRFEGWQKSVHPADHALVLAAVDDLRNGRVPRYSVEIRMLHRDGSWRWILSEADLERNEKGEPVMMMGSHIDITERKHAELALAASELFAKATVDA
ncbi:MAG: PAS domain S-box protein, partial [Rhodoferax sp.]|nr:PAS domain S-box protein [Rhodoferax sp.]